MPTYEYACRSCGEHLEAVQKFTDAPLTECPSCGGPLRKVFGNVGIAFKGSGFYKNDSRAAANGSSKKSSEPSSSSASESSSGSGGGSGESGGSAGGSANGSGGGEKAAAASSSSSS